MQKRLKLLRWVLLLGSLTFLYNCGKVTEPVGAPTIVAYVDTVANGNSGNFIVGDSIKIIVYATSAQNIQQINVTETITINGITTTKDLNGFPKTSGFGSDLNYYDTLPYKAGNADAVLKFEVVGVKGTRSTSTYTVKIAPLLKSIFSTRIGYFLNDSIGSYFSSFTNLVYTTAEANINQDTIDITFGVGDTTKAFKLISPDYRDNEGLKPYIGGNITYFGPSTLDINTVGPLEMAAIVPSSKKSVIIQNSGRDTTFQFINYLGKKGLIRVSDLQKAGPSDTINISVKIEVRTQQ